VTEARDNFYGTWDYNWSYCVIHTDENSAQLLFAHS
jgi:hypothetical protein